MPKEAHANLNDPNVCATDRAVLAHDREHGTEHGLAYYACKHCLAWAECDYVWDAQDAEDEDLEPEWATSCGGTGFIECECGGDFCACGAGEQECPGCEDCENDGTGDFDDGEDLP